MSDFFLEVYECVAVGDTAEALYLVLEQCYLWEELGNYVECNRALVEADFAQLETQVLLGFLSATKGFESKLPNRAEFVAKVVEHLMANEPPEEVDELLQGIV